MRRTMLLTMALLVAACSAVDRDADRYFVLDAAAPAGAAGPGAAVVVAPTAAAGFYDTQDIVYSPAAGVRAYYRYNHWTERPQRVVLRGLQQRLPPAAAPGAPVLETRLDELYHDAAQRPGVVRVALSAQLLDPVSRSVLARRSFSASAPAASYDAAGAVAGMRQALGPVLDDVAAWADGEARAVPRRAP